MTTKTEIETILAKNESLQLIGLSGMGKSHILRELDAIFIDTSIFYPIDYLSLLTDFAHNLKVDPESNNPTVIQEKISEKIKDNKTVIVIDGFEKILKPEFTQFFEFLKSLRDLHKQSLMYIFSVSGTKPIGQSDNKILGGLFRLVQENILYIKPYERDVFEQKVKDNFNQILNDQDIDLEDLYNKTGGIVSLIKAQLKQNKILLDSQVFEIKQQISNSPIEVLKNHGILDKNGIIISELLRNSNLSHSQELTVLEAALFNVLKDNQNSIVTKNKICEVVYPEVKNINGISDSSIDQLIHRLRKKLKGFSITNIHSQGFKLTAI